MGNQQPEMTAAEAADYVAIERRIMLSLMPTFTATKQEVLAKGYGMSAVRRWGQFVPLETRNRIKRRRRRSK